MEILKTRDYYSTVISEFEMYKRVLADQMLFTDQYISVLRPKLIDDFASFVERSYQMISAFYGDSFYGDYNDYNDSNEKRKNFLWTYKKKITIELINFLEQQKNISYKEDDGIDATLTVDDWMRKYFNVNLTYKLNEYMMLINMLCFEAAEKVSSTVTDDNFYVCKCSIPKLIDASLHISADIGAGKYLSDIKMHYPRINIIPRTGIRNFFDDLWETRTKKINPQSLLFGEYRSRLQDMSDAIFQFIYIPVRSCKKLAELYQLNYSIRNIFEMNNVNFDYKKFLK